MIVPAVAAQTAGREIVEVSLAAGWLRRDWHRCRNRALWSAQGGIMTVSSDTSAVLYWQVPTRSGQPLDVGAEQEWSRKCERPSLDFWKKVGKRDELLLQVEDFRYASWWWLIEAGDFRRENGIVVELGIDILKKGGNQLRELIYTWSHFLPEDSVRVEKKVVVPRIWEYKKSHVVVETGTEQAGEWVAEMRDIHADYKRAFPREEPGRIARVYLKLPRDVGRKFLKVSLTQIQFYTEKPTIQERGE